MIVKVGMIVLRQHNLDDAVEFYKKLGLACVFHIKESWAEFAIGSVKLGLCPTDQPPHENVTGIVLEVDNMHQFCAALKDSIPFKAKPFEKVHGIMASIQDPGGNVIDLYQPTPQNVKNLVKEIVEKDRESEPKKHCDEPDCDGGPHDADA